MAFYFRKPPALTFPLDHPKGIQTMAIAATEFPSTGFVVSNNSAAGQSSCGCFMIGDAFTPVVNSWESENGFYKDYNDWFRSNSNDKKRWSNKIQKPTLQQQVAIQHCDGMCYANLEAIGFEITCDQDVINSDIAVAPIKAFERNGNGSSGNSEDWTATIFNSSFSLAYPDSNLGLNTTAIVMNLNYFQSDNPYNPSDSNCAGRVFIKKCVFRPAMVTYPVKIMNYSNPHIINGVGLQSRIPGVDPGAMMDLGPPAYKRELRQAEGFKVGKYININDRREVGSLTSLGGLASAMEQFLGAEATITYNGLLKESSVWALKQQGTLAQTMMYGPPNMGSCDCSFRDASLDTIIESVNELTFLASIAMIDNSTFSGRKVVLDESATIVGVGKNDSTSFRSLDWTMQITDVVFYRTNFWFAGFAVLSTVVCVCLVIPSYWKYGELGREVTLGPIEVASAFRAPMLTEGRANAAEAGGDIKELIKDVGHRKVMYGFVDEREDHQEDHLPRRSRNSVRLAMSAPDTVRPASGVWSSPTSPTSPTMAKNPKI